MSENAKGMKEKNVDDLLLDFLKDPALKKYAEKLKKIENADKERALAEQNKKESQEKQL